MEYQAFLASPWEHGTFWVFVAIVIFAFLAGRPLLKAVTGLLDARTRSVQDALNEAAQLKAEAEALLAEAKTAQAQAVTDAANILAAAHAAAERMAAELAADAEAASKWRERMALERIAAAEAAAVKDVRAAAIDIATVASAAILRENLAAQPGAAQLDQAIAGLPDALRAKL
jgi:F-type H+-transporting ATPase subunit b